MINELLYFWIFSMSAIVFYVFLFWSMTRNILKINNEIKNQNKILEQMKQEINKLENLSEFKNG